MSNSADFWKGVPAQTAYLVVEEIADVRPADPGFDLFPGLILLRMEGEIFDKVAPGLCIGGIVLSDEQVVSSLKEVEIFYANLVYAFVDPADQEFYEKLVDEFFGDEEVGAPAKEPAAS